jgi:hypothetical protein
MNHGIARFSEPLLRLPRPAPRHHRPFLRPVDVPIARPVHEAEVSA